MIIDGKLFAEGLRAKLTEQIAVLKPSRPRFTRTGLSRYFSG